MTAQSLAAAHTLLSMLHFPAGPQSEACMQDCPLMLQAPGIVAQSAFLVQLRLVCTLHLPGFGVQIGGSQVVTGVHEFSGPGGNSSQPGGEYVTLQTGAWQV